MIKRNKILVGCLALLLVLSVGYALFSETITINGTATAKGNFDIGITCSLAAVEGSGTGKCTTGNNSVTTISTLTKPSEIISYEIIITNNGTIPAKLKSMSSPNNRNASWDAAGDCMYLDTSTYLGAYYMGSYYCDSEYNSSELVLAPGETEYIYIEHHWLDSKDWGFNVEQPKLPNGEASINYNLTFEFEQVTN